MRKIDAAIQALQLEYKFRNDISQIKTWWKVGGFYPFVNKSGDTTPSITDLQQEVKDNEEKLQFVISHLLPMRQANISNRCPLKI